MALETITQILAPTNAPYINGINGEKRISAAILKNMFQGLVEKNGKGVDDNYVSAGDAEEATQIVVRRVLPIKSDPREFGASKNGASYNSKQSYVQTIEENIDVLQVLDEVILLPRASRDRINVDLLAEQIQIWSDRWATIYNGATTASKILATYLKKSQSTNNEVNEVVISSSDVTNHKVLDRFIEGNSLLDEGDAEHGIDVFPQKTRVAVFRVSYRATLKAGGILTLGGANEVYNILAGSGLNNKGEARTEEDGYIGEIDGVEVHLISNESLGHAAKFLGFPETEFKKGGVFAGYVASSYANARGASTRERTKIVDEPNGQGIRLQPYVKFGAVCWYPLGNVFFTTEEYNPFKGLKDLLTAASVSGEVTFKLKGAGSRLYSDLVPANSQVKSGDVVTSKITGLSITGGTAVVGALFAADDWGVVNHIKAAAYVIGDKITTLAAFLKETYTTVAFDGTGSIDISGATAGKVINILTVSDDGTVTLAHSAALTA